MNIFVLDQDPRVAAQMYCDKHVPKMVVELYQQMGSAMRRAGVEDALMPLTKKGTPLKGGYHNHPCTRWVGDNRKNFCWAAEHALALCDEYTKRFGKKHFCEDGIEQMLNLHLEYGILPKGSFTPFALAMPDEFRPVSCHIKEGYLLHASGDTAVQAYRRYYHSKTFAKWEKGTDAPDWWKGIEADSIYGKRIYEVA
tara:strand:- start:2106 stop:2696 length:591 start_codon:yes stop_codon:yes gene_type:complete